MPDLTFALCNDKRYSARTMPRQHANTFLDDLAVRGRAWFTTGDALAALGPSAPAARMSLSRLHAAGRIASPAKGFYVVVAPEYRSLGCLPAEHFLDPLMGWLGVPYYIALLSAAAQHGAAHQAPMRTQVMVPAARRPIQCGGVVVDFVVRADMTDTPTRQVVGPRGYMRYATAEATALELVGYAPRCAGLSHVATVLAELAEVLDANALATEGRRCPVAWVQRLGWLLELVEQPTLAAALLPDVAARASSPTRLLPSYTTASAPRDRRWRLMVNTDVEPDDL